MCTIDYGDGDAARVWSKHHVKRARKEHRCQSCSLTIKTGRSYWSRFYVDSGGQASIEACCEVCWRIAERFGAEHHWTPTPSCIADVLVECIDYGDDDSKRWKVDLRKINARRRRARAERAAA